MYELDKTDDALTDFEKLESDKSLKIPLKAVKKALGLLQANPKHPGLHSSPIKGELCPHGSTIWHSYAQNNTPGAWRIFWCYVPKSDPTPEIPTPIPRILIIRISSHD
jgi:hypothetical protein